ncbi:MAG: NAD(P)-dependent oxidoreductase [Beijerinckiaceae bacterium]|nr:NAD(P)-dependent oxidoreductase [Beijerinckiaceae bacterium]
MDIGFVGLGAMGAHMARHLRAAGFPVHVFDKNPAAVGAATALGATAHASPAEVADAADAVIVCLPTPDVVRQVVLGEGGILQGSRIRIFVDCSTTGPSVAREISEALAPRQIASLDGPLAGGVAGAEAGTLSVMVSGPRFAFDEVAPVLRSFGRKVVHVGEKAGLGQTLKLVNNMIVGANLVVAAEAILFGVRAGLSAETILDVLNASTARSFVTEEIIAGKLLDRRFEFGFRLELMRKDLRLCIAEADATGAPMLVNAIAKQLYEAAAVHDDPASDMTRVVYQMEKAAGAVIERDAPAEA